MAGTKQRPHVVRHHMTNAPRRISIAKRVLARKTKTTSVLVPMVVPWCNPAHLEVAHKTQQAQLKTAMRDVGKLKGKMSMSVQVHGPKCPWSVVLWPRASDCADAEADEFMRNAIERRDKQCKCTPLIMYTGALA